MNQLISAKINNMSEEFRLPLEQKKKKKGRSDVAIFILHTRKTNVL